MLGDFIEEIHKKWWGRYGPLEAHHGYIQWLFPIREDGLNSYAQRLQLHEAKAIAADPVLQGRIIKSYELMLDFYGMKLTDRATGITVDVILKSKEQLDVETIGKRDMPI